MVFAGGIKQGDALAMALAGLALIVLFLVLNFAVDQACILPADPNLPATRAPETGGPDNCRGLIANYQLKRFRDLFGVNTKIGDDYQIRNANTALAGGGLWGLGYLQGTQTQLRFLPARHTDFIFSVIGEELGFVGAVGLILLLMLVIWRCLRAAWIAYDTFGRLICVSVAAVFFLQTYINLGMQVQLLPVTGVVLPFVSYGRSNLISAMIAIGLVESVAMRYKRLEF
jgi:rod shape determining protein RodA